MRKQLNSGVAIREYRPGRFRARLSYWEDGERRRVDFYGTSAAEVKKKLKEADKRISEAKTPKDQALTFGAYSLEWSETSLENSDRRPTTKATYKHLLKRLRSTSLASKPIGQVRPSHVEGALVELKKQGLADSTRRQCFAIMKALFGDAVRDRVIAYNPTQGVKAPKVAFKEAHFFTPEELREIFRQGEGFRYTPLFELMARTGLREGETLGLHWKDIDFEEKTITVRRTLSKVDGKFLLGDTKNARSRRTLHVSDRVLQILKSWRLKQKEERLRAGSQWQASDLVVTTQFGGPVDRRNLLRDLKKILDQVGIPGHVHSFRHSAASVMLVLEEVPLPVVSRILGHSSISMTVDVYGHLTKDKTGEALQALDRAI